jgi:hypothetical protein
MDLERVGAKLRWSRRTPGSVGGKSRGHLWSCSAWSQQGRTTQPS